MATGDVTISQDGGPNVKLHPYLITLVRWCMSCLWSTASVLLHRLVTAPLPPITASKQGSKVRQAGTDHLHPEPKVECVVLHTPDTPTLDVIFVHGLYGSLGNTWRQGDWRSKYKLDPTKVPLRNHTTTPCTCKTKQQSYNNIHFTYETNVNETEINEADSFKQFNGRLKKILPHENSLITENFYNNTFLNVNNYETQAKFVTELFKNNCNKNCDLNIDAYKCNMYGNENKCSRNECECKLNECACVLNEEVKLSKCEVGCGCVCDGCYSWCWPRDWLREDFPGARVISINYTSDPYLWRPLWVKGSKRLRLHERAEQMIDQLLALGVGSRPIIWVGHSKGGCLLNKYTVKLSDSKFGCGDRVIGDKQLVDISIHNDTDSDENGDISDKVIASSDSKEDIASLGLRSSLWVHSAGFMFYSVPHRGSPLAAIKTPITARSIELLEISKDCQLVSELQSRWLVAAQGRGGTTGSPVVRSLVETCRTLMSVLWLRIVSEDSADAGVGTLCGVSVDHREICKPSSRQCLLYKELTDTIHDALLHHNTYHTHT